MKSTTAFQRLPVISPMFRGSEIDEAFSINSETGTLGSARGEIDELRVAPDARGLQLQLRRVLRALA
jgi:hypothetical protein